MRDGESRRAVSCVTRLVKFCHVIEKTGGSSVENKFDSGSVCGFTVTANPVTGHIAFTRHGSGRVALFNVTVLTEGLGLLDGLGGQGAVAHNPNPDPNPSSSSDKQFLRYTYTHTHIHTCTHTHMHICTHTHMHTYTHTSNSTNRVHFSLTHHSFLAHSVLAQY